MLSRVSFFVDGFNLYHSLRDSRRDDLKWLDVVGLCGSLLRDMRSPSVQDATLGRRRRGGVVYHEEKGTDVWLAATLMESVLLGRCDAAVIVSGDTDFGPAARMARERVPVWFAPPPRRSPNPRKRRHHNELRRAATGLLTIRFRHYAENQLPGRIVDSAGTVVATRPKEYQAG